MGRLLALRCSFRRSRIFDAGMGWEERVWEERQGKRRGWGVHIDVEYGTGMRCVGYQ